MDRHGRPHALSLFMAMDAINQLLSEEPSVKGSDKRQFRQRQAIAHLNLCSLAGYSSCSHYSNRKKGFMDHEWPLSIAE